VAVARTPVFWARGGRVAVARMLAFWARGRGDAVFAGIAVARTLVRFARGRGAAVFASVAVAFVVAMGGCGTNAGAGGDLGVNGALDAAVYQECSSICLRPSDCAIAYPDGTICPPGFLCALRFHCGD
jgi:hypothetical protein